MSNSLGTDWPSFTIEELKATSDWAIAIGPFGSRMKADTYVPAGVPVIRGNNISDTKELTGEFVFISPEKADELRVSNVFEGDLVFPHRGLIGTVGLVPRGRDGRFVLSSSLMKLTCNRAIVEPRFLFYFFRSPAGRHELLKNASQVGTPGIATPLASLRQIRVPVPPLQVQRSIIEVLSPLDDKIALNRRLNATLEALARALFKSWFVDFDPVRAKVEGRQPAGMDAETAALFPDGFEDSAIGDVPRGWEVKPLDELGIFLNGLALQKYPPGGATFLPVIKIAQLRKGSTNGADRASADINSAYVVDDGDLLFSWSGSLEVVIWCGGRGALNQHLFKVTSSTYPKWLLYQWTRHHLPEFQRIAAGKATTMGHIQRHHLAQALTVAPPEPLLKRLDEIMAPLMEKGIANSLEARTLSETRDALLPRLLSGEVRVGEVAADLETDVTKGVHNSTV